MVVHELKNVFYKGLLTDPKMGKIIDNNPEKVHKVQILMD